MKSAFWCTFGLIERRPTQKTWTSRCTIFSRRGDQLCRRHMWSVPRCQDHFIQHHWLFPCNMKWRNLHCQIWMAMFMLLAGLASAPFAILYFPADLSIFLPRSVLKVAEVSTFPSHASSSFRPSQETVVMVWLRARSYTCIRIAKGLILIQWSTINSTISCTQDVLLQIISWWKLDVKFAQR